MTQTFVKGHTLNTFVLIPHPTSLYFQWTISGHVPPPRKCLFPCGERDPIKSPYKVPLPLPQRHLDRFIRFCRAHQCAQHTQAEHTILYAATKCIAATKPMWPENVKKHWVKLGLLKNSLTNTFRRSGINSD